MAQNVVTASPCHIRQKLSFLSLRRSEQQQKRRQKQHQLPSSAPHDSDGNSTVLIALITSTAKMLEHIIRWRHIQFPALKHWTEGC